MTLSAPFRPSRSMQLMLLTIALIAAAATSCFAGNPTLGISPSLTLVPAKEGGEGTDVIKVMTGGSFRGNVDLKISGLPSSITARWSSDSLATTSGVAYSTLTVAPSAETPVNWYAFTVTASGDGLSVSKRYAVQVRPAVGMQIALSHSALSIWHNATSDLSVTASPLHELTFSNLSIKIVSGLPSGVSVWWSKAIPAAGGAVAWDLQLAASSTVKTGSYPIELSTQFTDPLSGLLYTSTQQFPLLVSLVAAAAVNVDSEPGRTIPATFMGLSHEWWEPIYLMGEETTGTNPIYRQLMKNLTAYGSGPINVRIGGNTADTSGEPSSTTIPPMADLAKALGTKFELSVNLGEDNVGLAVSQAKAYTSQMPSGSVSAIEIGNEPDLYHVNGYRPSTYTIDDYFADFQKWKDNIMPVLPAGVKLMGPSWASTGLGEYLPTFLSENSSDLAIVSQHNGIYHKAANPPDNVLLASSAATAAPSQVTPEVSAAHGYGLPFRMGEICAGDDGGIPAISQAFAAALWGIDTMFEYFNAGVDGVNWLASINDGNNPFMFSTDKSGGTTKFSLSAVTAPYYGMLFFQAATANQAKLLPVSLAAQANFKAWATIDSEGTPRLVLINKDQHYAGNVSISVPGYSRASVLRLSAPAYNSMSGITFAGQTFDGSPDGTIQGKESIETIDGDNGVFQIDIGFTSAELLVFSN